jgi:hypothetical protein
MKMLPFERTSVIAVAVECVLEEVREDGELEAAKTTPYRIHVGRDRRLFQELALVSSKRSCFFITSLSFSTSIYTHIYMGIDDEHRWV